MIDFAKMFTKMSKNEISTYGKSMKFKLAADLDFANTDETNNENGSFLPINNFTGYFNGKGHTISNLSYNNTSEQFAGLFSTVYNATAIIENVTLINPKIAGYFAVGGIVGELYDGTIRNCNVVGGTIYSFGSVGGIVGVLRKGTIQNCNVVGGTINNEKTYSGGIVGFCPDNEAVKTISNCTVVGTTINAKDYYGRYYFGCIVGANSDLSNADATLTISNCLYDVASNENICGDGYGKIFTDGGGNKPLYRLNLGYGVKSDAPTYGDYVVATEGTTVKLDATASRESYDFAGFKINDVTINNGQFKMPAESVNVEINWEAQENISVKASQVNDLYWTTFYCGDAGYYILEDEEAFAYTATVSDDKITLHLLGKVIPMGTAAIIIGEDNSISMYRDDFSIADYSADNDLQGVDVRTLKSTLDNTGTGTFYVMGSTTKNGFGFHKYTADYMPARKAYLLLDGGVAQASSLTMVFDNETTEIKTTDFTFATPHSQRENYTDKADTWYSLDGRKLDKQPTAKGIYIHNGRKEVVR